MRKSFIYKLLAFIGFVSLLAFILIEVEGFETLFEISRAYEDWELDEIIIVATVVLIFGSLWLAVESRLLYTELEKENQKRVAAEQELSEIRRIEALSTLSAGIAHTGNNLMQPILSLARITRGQLAADSAAYDSLEKIEMAASHASELFSSVLRLSRREVEDARATDVVNLVKKNQLLFNAAVPSLIKLTFEFKLDTAEVAISGANFVDILLVLISNGVDAHGGRPGHLSIVIDDAAGSPGYLMMTVTDSGAGIPNDKIDRVFDSFYTGKDVGKGTGLGLSLASSLVRQAGGTIRVDSELDIGSAFTILLPYTGPELAEEEEVT